MKHFLLPLFVFAFSSIHAGEHQVIEAVQEYLDFAEYGDGSISPQQIAGETDSIVFIDTRARKQFDESHIPGAMHIEWRQILNQADRIPTDKTVVLYCDTGLMSSKAHFALRLVGFDNIKVLVGGYREWLQLKQNTTD